MTNLLRVSHASRTPNFPLKSSTLYAWRHYRKHPELFVKLGSACYINLDKLDALIAKGGTINSDD